MTIHCQEFHELAMDYRGADVGNVAQAYDALLAYIGALVAAAAPAVVQAEPSEWQPIATAPKDGTSILLYTAEGMVEASFSWGRWEQSPCYATYDGCGGVALSCEPTHWMPLPAAPKVSP